MSENAWKDIVDFVTQKKAEGSERAPKKNWENPKSSDLGYVGVAPSGMARNAAGKLESHRKELEKALKD
jgi:hypothetical protein